MKIINNYNDITPGNLQQARLYLQGRPLISVGRKDKKNSNYCRPEYCNLIDQELNGNYISIDCGGWYFSNDQRQCVAIELDNHSRALWPNVHFEYDYLTWCPDYLSPDPVLAYYSTCFKYCQLSDIITFFNRWGLRHPKLIVGLDPTKIKFNYLKYNFLDILSKQIDFTSKITVLEQSNFNLLFTIEKI